MRPPNCQIKITVNISAYTVICNFTMYATQVIQRKLTANLNILCKVVIKFCPYSPSSKFVTQNEKTILMYTKYTSLHYFNYPIFCVSYTSSVNCIGFIIVSCTISNTILKSKNLKFKIQCLKIL